MAPGRDTCVVRIFNAYAVAQQRQVSRESSSTQRAEYRAVTASGHVLRPISAILLPVLKRARECGPDLTHRMVNSSKTVKAAAGREQQEPLCLSVSMASTCPTPRQWVTSLISAIPPAKPDSDQPSNPLRDLSPQSRNILLTLYALFERDILPALDLLDRGLVTRLVTPQPQTSQQPSSPLYIVRSAQQQKTRGATHDYVNNYEVRLKAWNCSCPAFAFAAFSAPTSPEAEPSPSGECLRPGQYLVGGVSLGEDMPVCKHLLGCLLAEYCSIFSHLLQDKAVTLEEVAGWSAGWGD